MCNKLIKIYYKIKYKIINIFVFLQRVIFRTFFQIFDMYPSSKPFLSGDTFRQLSTLVYSGKKLHLNKPEIIFVQSNLLKLFLYQIDNIRKKFILISHNGDDLVDWQYNKILNNKFLVKWYSANIVIKDKKIVPIPLGLQNYRSHLFGVIKDFKNLRNEKKIKKPRIFCSFNFWTNPNSRIKLLQIVKNNKNADFVTGLTAYEYRKKLNNYMFQVSPEGNGLDTYRTWESFYLDVIPIVLRNNLYEQFEDFPALILEDWKELESFTQHDLEQIYTIKLKKLNECKYIWFEYWIKHIQINLKQKLF